LANEAGFQTVGDLAMVIMSTHMIRLDDAW
jgi:hypothetical protein